MVIIKAQKKKCQRRVKKVYLFLLSNDIIKAVQRCCFCCLFGLLFSVCLFSNAFSADRNDERVKFLTNLKTLQANFMQKQYDGDKVEISAGSIAVKKPNSVLLTHNGKDMKLKFVSINGNVKIFDENIGQTTYVDNQYSDLIQFFTDNLKPEKLIVSRTGELCLPFESFGADYLACLNVDVKVNNIKSLHLYILAEDEKNKKSNKKQKLQYKVADFLFKDVMLNKNIADDMFVIKDTRIFDDEE